MAGGLDEEWKKVAFNGGEERFFSFHDKERVLGGRPWSFDNILLLLPEVTRDLQLLEHEFGLSLFRIRIYDAPLDRRIEKVAKDIRDNKVSFTGLDDSDPLGREPYMRFRAHVDIHKSLQRGTTIHNRHVGKDYKEEGDTKAYDIIYTYGVWLRAN
ncbi:hypothetical protein Cgig2_005888 [Carnegiea gigantea]|uniref:DUF4283 domain-containing protein n=1 Tax=Carnegiea gigantea TaxID=171969 RepID=A0A9Q1JPV9_9CARY|nr:hypothetical protein Cgig2_005888 [Carnegiea gigantea]